MALTFRNAVIISVLIHSLAVLYPGGHKLVAQKLIKDSPIVVDYVIIKEPKKIEAVTEEKKSAMMDTPKTELLPKVETKPEPVSAAITRSDADKKASEELAAKQAEIKSTKDYVNYYQLIRERIRQRLKDKYRSYFTGGDVCLVFVLRSDGSLISFGVNQSASTHDRTLINTAVQSLKEAAPFAPFPKALSVSQMSFTLTVSFKQQ